MSKMKLLTVGLCALLLVPDGYSPRLADLMALEPAPAQGKDDLKADLDAVQRLWDIDLPIEPYLEKAAINRLSAWQKAANAGLPQAQTLIGLCYSLGTGVQKNDARSVEWFSGAAESGEPMAMVRLGIAFESGKGVKKDLKDAMSWYRKAAGSGYPMGQVYLGDMYAWGSGVGKDSEEAVAWFRMATLQGNVRGQTRLGDMYLGGEGVRQDYDTAAKWYRKAASQNYAEAEFSLGLLYAQRKNNPLEAVPWYRKAAERGHVKACLHLASLYDLGRGVPKNKPQENKAQAARLRAKARALLNEEQLFRRTLLAEAINKKELIGQRLPDFELTQGGKRFKLSEQRGRIVLLSFTASWCAPSRRMDPYKKALAKRLKDLPFELITIDTDKERQIAADWDTRTIPRTYIIDDRGVTRAFFEGYAEGSRLDKVIDELLAEKESLGQSLAKDNRTDDFYRFVRLFEPGAIPLEMRVGSGKNKTFIDRHEGKYRATEKAAPNAILHPDSPIRYVLEMPPEEGRHVRVEGEAILLPTNPKSGKIDSKEIARAKEVVAFLRKRPKLLVAVSNLTSLDEESLAKLGRRYDDLGKPLVLSVETKEGKPILLRASGTADLSVETLLQWAQDPGKDKLPDRWLEKLKQQPVVVDAHTFGDGLHLTKGTELVEALTKLESEGVEIFYWDNKRVKETDLSEWLQEMLSVKHLDFEGEPVALEGLSSYWQTAYVRKWVRRSQNSPRDSSVHVIIDHDDNEQTIDKLIERANAGKYTGRHVVLAVCNDNPKKVREFREAAYRNGCLSLTVPFSKVNVPVVIMTAQLLNGDTSALAGKTPQQAWVFQQNKVIKILEEVKAEAAKAKPEDQAKTVRELLDNHFPGADLADMFLAPGVRPEKGQEPTEDQIKKAEKGILKEIEKAIKEVEQMRGTWKQTKRGPKAPNEYLLLVA